MEKVTRGRTEERRRPPFRRAGRSVFSDHAASAPLCRGRLRLSCGLRRQTSPRTMSRGARLPLAPLSHAFTVLAFRGSTLPSRSWEERLRSWNAKASKGNLTEFHVLNACGAAHSSLLSRERSERIRGEKAPLQSFPLSSQSLFGAAVLGVQLLFAGFKAPTKLPPTRPLQGGFPRLELSAGLIGKSNSSTERC
ncbi:hypothetical protein AOLI_G00220370 [Acnodon oligacanthus]